ASMLPIELLGDLVSLGTAVAFGIVCLSVMFLRTRRPDIERPFNVPLGGGLVPKFWIPILTLVILLGEFQFFKSVFKSTWTDIGDIVVLVAVGLWTLVSIKSLRDKVWIGIVPVLGIIGATFMVEPLIEDILTKAFSGDLIPAELLGGYILVGALIYFLYG